MFFSNVFAEPLKAMFNLCSICNLICMMLLPQGASAVNGTGWLCLRSQGGWTRSPCPGLLCQGAPETSRTPKPRAKCCYMVVCTKLACQQ